jgi:hypothetical protein
VQQLLPHETVKLCGVNECVLFWRADSQWGRGVAARASPHGETEAGANGQFQVHRHSHFFFFTIRLEIDGVSRRIKRRCGLIESMRGRMREGPSSIVTRRSLVGVWAGDWVGGDAYTLFSVVV